MMILQLWSAFLTKFSKKLASNDLSSNELILPLLPPWPPIKFIFNKIGLSDVEYSRNFGTYLAGSKYWTWESNKLYVTNTAG